VLRHVQQKAGMDAAAAQAVVSDAIAGADAGAGFWTVSDKGKVRIDVHALYRWLHVSEGFGLYWVDGDHGKEYRIIQVNSRVMREATTEMMIKAVNGYLSELPEVVGEVLRADIERAFMESTGRLFGGLMIEHLGRHDVTALAHEVDTAYFPFKNGWRLFVKVMRCA
jgi:hypothetical protein